MAEGSQPGKRKAVSNTDWMHGIVVIATAATILCGCARKHDGISPRADEPESAAKVSPVEELTATLDAPPAKELTPRQASQLIELSLACVDREYPNKPSHVVDGDETVLPPRKLHPAFHGCFDWHSAVHGHWAMVRVLKKFPGIDQAEQIRDALDRHINEQTIAGEMEYFRADRNALFERPYGWGWLMRLHAELGTFDDPDARRWAEALQPLAELIAGRAQGYLDVLSVPVRAGTHHNTAYALCHMHDWATALGDEKMQASIEDASRRFYLQDRACPTGYEPSGEDFISPCLAEAELMMRVLPADEYTAWLDDFLPAPDSPGFEPLLGPVDVKDRKDPKIGHLIGLFLQRASSYRLMAQGLPEGDPRVLLFTRLASIHADAGLTQMFDSGYGGEHWLASFAIHHLSGSGPY